MKNIFLTLFFLAFIAGDIFAQYANWTTTSLLLDNGVVQRTIQLPAPEGNFLTTSYKPVSGEFKYFRPTNIDFQFEANGLTYSGQSTWRLLNIKSIKDSLQGDGAAVVLLSLDKKIELTLKYILYPNLPVIRKSLIIKNLTMKEVSLESADIEKFNVTEYESHTFSWIYSDYGRRKSIGPYEGNVQDALVIVHNMDWEAGIVLGNEASGLLKRTAVFWDGAEISCGLTHKNGRFPFRKWIKSGESFETPQVFSMVYNNQKDPEEILSSSVPDFVRKHLGIRLSLLKNKPTFVYNTWHPFEYNINEQLIMELAKAAADAGMKEFIIDDGWQDNYGDWGINTIKFPHGLKPVFDYIKSLGMKPGLWLCVASASTKSKVFKDHPEWFGKDKYGNFSNVQNGDSTDIVRSACLSTGWKEYVKAKLINLASEYGLEYLKLDFAVVSSPYVFDITKTGCYAKDHPGHQDQRESMYVNYERMWELYDELHASIPNLFIDCTFETTGALQMIDYAMLKHAEGNWLSNFQGDMGEKTDLRIRNMAWWRSPAISATALVIGNSQMQDKGWEMHIKSIAGALPMLLGDPRKLSPEDLKKYKFYADWLLKMEKAYGIMNFRQDLPGFGEPAEGRWDGFQRINTDDKTGGIIALFRQGAVETTRRISVKYLDPAKNYDVRFMDGKILTNKTGEHLRSNGFELNLPDLYSGELLEIRKSD